MQRLRALLLMVVVLCMPNAAFTAPLTLLEAVNLTSLYESTAYTLFALNNLGFLPTVFNATLTGTYSETGWSSSVSGAGLTMNYSGTLAGSPPADLSVLFSGGGTLNSHVFASSGVTTWLYDSSLNDYAAIVHTESGNINPSWGVTAAEVVGGGIIGGLFGGWAGVVGGAGVGVVISNAVIGPTPPPPPAPPPRPIIIIIPLPPPPKDGETQTIIGNNNVKILNTGKGNIEIKGSFINGNVTGDITGIPEPSGLLLSCTGGIALLLMRWGVRRRQRRISQLPPL